MAQLQGNAIEGQVVASGPWFRVPPDGKYAQQPWQPIREAVVEHNRETAYREALQPSAHWPPWSRDAS